MCERVINVNMNIVKMQRLIPNTVSETVMYWLQNSSIDGLGHAGRARSSVSQLMWMVLVIVGSIGTGLNIYYVLYDYFLYEVRASILLSSNAKVRRDLFLNWFNALQKPHDLNMCFYKTHANHD